MAPEIELVGRVENSPVVPPLRPSGWPDARSAAGKSQGGEERRARDLALGIRLHDAADRGRDVEIGSLRFLKKACELVRAVCAPPVECGQCWLNVATRREIR